MPTITREQAQSLYDRLNTSLAERSLYQFLRQAWPILRGRRPFAPAKHIQAVCEHLEAVSSGQIKRLLINIPPRSTKSTVCGVMWQAWDWIHKPERGWFTVSHRRELAVRDTRGMRQVVQSDWYQQRWPLTFARDQNQKIRFENDSMGYRLAAGLGEGFIGEGGDIILLDDPHDREEAYSDVQRQATIDAFDEKLTTRLNDPDTGSIVVIGQRMHEYDLFAHLLGQGGWEHLCIPMQFEEDHPTPTKTSLNWRDWRTVEGESICPARFSPRALERRHRGMGEVAVASQEQQRPVPKGGIMFKREYLEVVRETPQITAAVRYWDKAGTSGDGDWTVGLLLGKSQDGTFYILDIVRGQWSAGARNNVILSTAELDSRRGYQVRTWLEREGGSGGKESAEISERELAEYGGRTEQVTGSKVIRASNLIPAWEARRVKMLAAPWNFDFVSEVIAFPNGKNDDQVDGLSGSYGKLATQKKWLVA